MKKEIALVAVLVLALLASMFVETQTVKAAAAPEVSIEVTDGSYTPCINQQVELTAVVSDGTPPYTYQWYTIFIPQDLLDKGPKALLDGRVVKVEVPGANSSKFNFTASTPGTYDVNLRIIDAFGCDIEVGSNVFTVQASPSPSSSSTIFNGTINGFRVEPTNSTINPTYLPQKTPVPSQPENLSSIGNAAYSPEIFFLMGISAAFFLSILLVYFSKRRFKS